MDKKSWDKFQLRDYVSNFSTEQRENVLKQIVEADLLSQVFETTEGKLILNSAVDIITNNTMKIVSLCIGSEKGKIDKITEAAHQINVTHAMMYKWATMLTTGKAHEGEIKKVKK